MRKYQHYATSFLAPDPCLTIKEYNNKQKSFCRGKLPSFPHKLPLC